MAGENRSNQFLLRDGVSGEFSDIKNSLLSQEPISLEIIVPFKRAFFSTIPSINYIFSNGKPAMFIKGRYLTDSEKEIKELEADIAAGHPHIHINPEEREVDTDKLDPISTLRASIEKEILARYKLAVNPDNDAGTYESEKIKPASTTDVASIAAGGSGVQTVLSGRSK